MISDNFAYWGFSTGWSVVRRMSDKRAYGLFNRMADQFWRRRGESVLQYERNLARVMPEADENQLRLASREGLRSYARYWCDAFRMPDWPLERIVNLIVENAGAQKGTLILKRSEELIIEAQIDIDIGSVDVIFCLFILITFQMNRSMHFTLLYYR